MYLVEEPGSGVDPDALEAVHAALSSVRGAQVLAATHSRELAGHFEPKEILEFRRGPLGETVVAGGDAGSSAGELPETEPPPEGGSDDEIGIGNSPLV